MIPEARAGPVEDLAMRLALEAGVAWDRLGSYPGYARNMWRERARAVLALAREPIAAPADERPSR